VFDLGLVLTCPVASTGQTGGGLIIDHTCTDLSKIPSFWIEQAKQLTIHYAHTSHGSQINSGLENLESLDPTYSFARRTSGSEGLPPIEDPPALRMYDGNPPETYIGPEDYWSTESGRNRTRAVAGTGNYDFSMWAWCGQVSSSSTNITSYLDTLNQFEAEYPSMRFIYMTGHLDGSGSSGTLHQQNEQIRAYCRANHKVLFDFADIERYDPDGVDYLDLGADDECDYSGGNWANQWCAANPASALCDSCACAHSKALNCNQKARAFWWMMARLAGWPGPAPKAAFDATPTTGDSPLNVQFSDQSTGDISAYLWNFGDGTTSTVPNPIHSYRATGGSPYSVSLTVSNSGSQLVDTLTKDDYITVETCSDGLQPVHNETGATYAADPQTAYNDATSNDTICMKALHFNGPLICDDPEAIVMSGGFGCNYSSTPLGMTTIGTALRIEAGSLFLEEGCIGIAP
jgi:PKD repeat protein